MQDLAIILNNRPGALAEMGEILGAAGVSLEGGGVFVHNGQGVAHFLVTMAEKGKQALASHGIVDVSINDVLIQKLNQEVPGQLGKICRIMAENGVNILTQYSDHANQLILVVDDYTTGQKISNQWTAGVYE